MAVTSALIDLSYFNNDLINFNIATCKKGSLVPEI